MNKSAVLIVTIVMAITATAIATLALPSSNDSVTIMNPHDGDIYTSYSDEMKWFDYPGIAYENNKFAIDFYREISDTPENIFFSPVSMYMVFSMLHDGTRENTAQEMEDVFGFEPYRGGVLSGSVYHLIPWINAGNSHIALNIANAFWIVEGFEPDDSYTFETQNIHRSTAEKVDFMDTDDGINKINQWVSDNTKGKIKKVITSAKVDDHTAMIINNVIYFKGTWVTQFPEKDTEVSTFWKNSEDSVDADFMTV